MKLRTMAASMAVLFSLSVHSQSPDNHAYAITSETKGSFEWTEVKLIDLSTGDVVSNVFENAKGNYTVFDGRSAKPLSPGKAGDSSTLGDKRPFAGLSAACAYDKKNNRLFYAPMFINQLRYIDLASGTPGVYLFENEPFSSATDLGIEANQITRMVIAADGNGYAMNNDGSHLIKFTTDGSPLITDLGAITDASGNGEIKIDDANTSWGGDMVADASGNLYVITAHNYVFKIDVQTRVATYIAKIDDLPVGFTTNGAAVNSEGQIVLSSANFITAYYSVDPIEWLAKMIPAGEYVYNTSDLANDHLLFQTQLAREQAPAAPEKIDVYPNPVKSNMFRVSFSNKEAGLYRVQLMDIAGRTVSEKSLSVVNSGQVSDVKLDPSLSRGMYMVKVLNRSNNAVFLRKIIVE